MITRIRGRVERLLRIVSRPLSVLPANFYTLLALIASATFIIACYLREVGLALALLLLSGLLDAVDGCVARFRGEASSRGALLDSVCDRVSDVNYGLGLILLGLPILLVYLWVTSSLMISYIRARYESLKPYSKLEGVGIMERGDRILLLLVLLLTFHLLGRSYALLVLIVGVILAFITVVERFVKAYTMLSGQ